MKEILQSVMKTTEERVKNPLIGAFIPSWALFNWKPILHVVFANADMASKIRFVEDNYCSLGNLLIFPFFVAFAYVLLLPYMNLAIDYLLKNSIIRRHKFVTDRKVYEIEAETKIEIARIEREEKQSEFRERKKENEVVQEMQQKMILIENELALEKEQNKKLMESRIEYRKEKNAELEKLSQSYSNDINSLRAELERKETQIREITINTENHPGLLPEDIVLGDGRVLSVYKKDQNNEVIQYRNNATGEVFSLDKVRNLKSRYGYRSGNFKLIPL